MVRKFIQIQITFAGDHRVLDGATVARFVKEWNTLLQTPELMIINST